MTEKIRLRVALTPSRRLELEQLAKDAGMSSAAPARLAIFRLLNSPEVLLSPSAPRQAA